MPAAAAAGRARRRAAAGRSRRGRRGRQRADASAAPPAVRSRGAREPAPLDAVVPAALSRQRRRHHGALDRRSGARRPGARGPSRSSSTACSATCRCPRSLATLADRVLGPNPVALLVTVAVGGLLLQLLLEVRADVAHPAAGARPASASSTTCGARLLDHLLALGLRHHIVTRTADSVYRLESDAYCVNDLAMGGVFPLGRRRRSSSR